MFISYKHSHKLRKAKTTDVQQHKQAVLREKRYSLTNCILLGLQSSLHRRVREVIWWGLIHNDSLEGCVSQDTCTCICSCPCNSILRPHRNVRELSGIWRAWRCRLDSSQTDTDPSTCTGILVSSWIRLLRLARNWLARLQIYGSLQDPDEKEKGNVSSASGFSMADLHVMVHTKVWRRANL